MGNAYQRKKDRDLADKRGKAASVRDVGEMPKRKRPRIWNACRPDLMRFGMEYFPNTFNLPPSPDHRRAVKRLQECILSGGQFALAMPRGSGKTSWCECACVWAVLYGHRSFVALIGSESVAAGEMLESIRMELETNELLQGDFPEVCHPIEKLEGITQRRLIHRYTLKRGKLVYNPEGKDTLIRMRFTSTHIMLPDLPGSPSASAFIRAAGLTGRIRGMKLKRPDGKSARPDVCIIDDPQTDESARSLTQCASRERLLAGAVLGLAGPRKKIAAIMPCTVIAPGDMADRILDRNKHPIWNGERTKMLYSLPANEDLWNQYGDIRAASYRRWQDGRDGNEFYAARRKEMDEGAHVAWPERFNEDELSAIQHAMNLKLQDNHTFMAEYQNDPLALPLEGDVVEILTADQISEKLSGFARGVIPQQCQKVTAFIDPKQDLLYWLVCAWADDFTGFVVDYGTFPDQKKSYFAAREATRTLSTLTPNGGVEAAMFAGLEQCVHLICGKTWQRDDGASLKLDRCLIDANFGAITDVVYDFCRRSLYKQVMPSHGKFYGASTTPLNHRAEKPGEKVGMNWLTTKGQRPSLYVLFDTNFYKTFAHARLFVPTGDPGCLSLFGDDPLTHRLLADHLVAEYRVRVEAKGSGRIVDEWKIKPERPDNDWLDCLVGNCVAASVEGISLDRMTAKIGIPKKPRKVRLSELQSQRRMGR